jgi:hypothetical protein
MKGLVYKITDIETNEVYIGSTIRTIKARIHQHRGQKCCRAHDMVVRDNYRVNILEEIDFGNIVDDELKKCEQKHMDKHDNLINKNRAFGTGNDKEYYKNYYQKNKEKYKARNGDRKAQYAWKKTWGDVNNNLIDINMNVFF